jgi:hypothetical protein
LERDTLRLEAGAIIASQRAHHVITTRSSTRIRAGISGTRGSIEPHASAITDANHRRDRDRRQRRGH